MKKFHDSQRNVRRSAEFEPGTVDKNDHPTTKVRKFIFPEDIKDEIDMLVLSKQLEDMEKVAMDEDRYLKYLKLKLKYLQRKINIHQLKLIASTSSSVRNRKPGIVKVCESCFKMFSSKSILNRHKKNIS